MRRIPSGRKTFSRITASYYCKVMAPDPQIVCLIYESTDPNARLAQVEWIYAKKLTRPAVSLKDWNKNWHDHAVEIAGGRPGARSAAGQSQRSCRYRCYHRRHDLSLLFRWNFAQRKDQYCSGGRSQAANGSGVQSIHGCKVGDQEFPRRFPGELSCRAK